MALSITTMGTDVLSRKLCRAKCPGLVVVREQVNEAVTGPSPSARSAVTLAHGIWCARPVAHLGSVGSIHRHPGAELILGERETKECRSGAALTPRE